MEATPLTKSIIIFNQRLIVPWGVFCSRMLRKWRASIARAWKVNECMEVGLEYSNACCVSAGTNLLKWQGFCGEMYQAFVGKKMLDRVS